MFLIAAYWERHQLSSFVSNTLSLPLLNLKSPNSVHSISGATLNILRTIFSASVGVLHGSWPSKNKGFIGTPSNMASDVILTPPQMPETCPGLDPDDIKIVGLDMWVGDEVKLQHVMEVGEVDLKYDARADGSLANISVVKSNHPCFEPNAIAAAAQWKAEPQDKEVKEIAVKIKFIVTGETHEDLEPTLNRLLK